jgi:hypothetical protein
MSQRFFYLIVALLISSAVVMFRAPFVAAITVAPTASEASGMVGIVDLQPPLATMAAEASDSGKLASASSQVQQIIQEKKDQDLTETGGQKKSKLAAYLDEHPIGALSWHNPLQHAIRKSIENGLPANLIVLLLLFPLVASIIATSRHVVGLTGYGIYIPAVLSVAFVSTGVPIGVATFLAILVAAVVSHKLIRRLKMPYLPRTAMLLWAVSIFTLSLLIVSAIIGFDALLVVNIFPVLIIMLLTENFLETQLFKSQKEAIRLTLETLVIAISCSIFMGWEVVQRFVLLRPELILLATAGFNTALGRYTGLRLLEYLRFQSILDKK